MKIAGKAALVLGVVFAGLVESSPSAAIRPQLTRVIAYVEDRETAVEVINDSNETYMVQSWLEDLDGKDDSIPLILTPPVMKLEGKKQGKLRLMPMAGAIPQDRESVYWLSLQEIPPKASEGENRLVVAIRSRLKVFVRPSGLDSAGAREAAKTLRWSIENDGGKRWLKATNPSSYYVSFGKLNVTGGGQKAVMVEDKHLMPPPKGTMRYALPATVGGTKLTVTWSGVSDWGGAGEEFRQDIAQ